MNEHRKAAEAARRKQRLASALRENLKRRRTQAKSRAATTESAKPPHDSAGIAAQKTDG